MSIGATNNSVSGGSIGGALALGDDWEGNALSWLALVAPGGTFARVPHQE